MPIIGVTGASGYLAGALIPRLAGESYSFRLMDNRSGPVAAVHADWPVERLDLREPRALEFLSGSDAVLHLAATSGVMSCATDPEGTRVVNVESTQRLVEWCRKGGIPVAFASSFAVVGAPERLPITEETPAQPTHEYARQKAEGEAAVRGLGDAHGPGGAILRMSNLYGHYQIAGHRIAKGNVVNLFLIQAQTGRLEVNAPGTQRRDFIHLNDAVEHWVAVARLLLSPRARGRVPVFNVASGETYSVLEVADLFQRAWSRSRLHESPLRVDMVPNPRSAIELLQSEFVVDRRRTERDLGVRCRNELENFIDAALREPLLDRVEG